MVCLVPSSFHNIYIYSPIPGPSVVDYFLAMRNEYNYPHPLNRTYNNVQLAAAAQSESYNNYYEVYSEEEYE